MRWHSVNLLLGQRRRRCPNSKSTLDDLLVFDVTCGGDKQ